MPKAKKVRNARMTNAPSNRRRKRLKEDGRPRGTFKKYKFEETKLGFMLKHETPVVYGILTNTLIWTSCSEPSVELIEVICRASQDTSFKKPKFRRYLKEYAQCGLYCHRPKRMTPEREAYYKRIRSIKLATFIQYNQKNNQVNYSVLRGHCLFDSQYSKED